MKPLEWIQKFEEDSKLLETVSSNSQTESDAIRTAALSYLFAVTKFPTEWDIFIKECDQPLELSELENLKHMGVLDDEP